MRYEKELIPVLTDFLGEKLGYSRIANEVDSGYGIADIVATVDAQECQYYPFNNLADVYLLNSMPLNKPIPFEELNLMAPYSEKHLKYVVLKDFANADLIEKEGDCYRRIKKLPVMKNPVIAIEAKLKKWKTALLQAKRYMKYADFCYVALPESTVKNIDLKMFEESNIGVIAVTAEKNAYKVLKSKKNRFKDEFYSIYVNGLLFKDSRATMTN